MGREASACPNLGGGSPPLCQPISQAKLACPLRMEKRALLLELPQVLTEAKMENEEKAPQDLADESQGWKLD